MHTDIHTQTQTHRLDTYLYRCFFHTYLPTSLHASIDTCIVALTHTHTKDQWFLALLGYLGGKFTMAPTSLQAIDVEQTQTVAEGKSLFEVANNSELHLSTYWPCKMRTALSIHGYTLLCQLCIQD